MEAPDMTAARESSPVRPGKTLKSTMRTKCRCESLNGFSSIPKPISRKSMPKSKNTRKKAYRPRQVKIGPYWPADQQADVEDKLTKVALYVESTLPTGAATEQQIDWIEDVFIWCSTSAIDILTVRRSVRPGDWPWMESTRSRRSSTGSGPDKHMDMWPPVRNSS